MAVGFPLHISIEGNNCTVFGGGDSALRRVRELRRFGAKITVISAQVCPELKQMSDAGDIRHIPRNYFRGDCTNSQLCVAAAETASQNILIASECKAKSIPVNVTDPEDYGTFTFPRVLMMDGVIISIAGDVPTDTLCRLRDRLKEEIPAMLKDIENTATE